MENITVVIIGIAANIIKYTVPNKDILNIKYTNNPVIKKVMIVPKVDIKIEGTAFGLAILQLVPKPP